MQVSLALWTFYKKAEKVEPLLKQCNKVTLNSSLTEILEQLSGPEAISLVDDERN